jgi:PAS domain S-box-containing protein
MAKSRVPTASAAVHPTAAPPAPPAPPAPVRRGGPALETLPGQARVLERIARGAPLPEVLEATVALIENAAPGMLCSILVLDRDGRHLRSGAAPSLPPDYNAAVDGIAIGPAVGSCGTAAFRREPVFVQDVQTDPLWAEFRDLAAQHELRACWSTPILSAGGAVLGTFAMYYRQPRLPTRAEQDLIAVATNLAGIALERRQAEEALRESEERFSKAFHANPAPLSITRLEDGRFLDVNQAFLRLIGYRREEIIGSTSIERGVIDGAERAALVERLGRVGLIPEMELVIRNRDGAQRDVVLSLVLCELAGEACTLGIYLDVTERKRAEEALRTRERQLVMAQQIGRMGSWEWDIRSGAVVWSDEMCRIFGQDPATARPSYDAFFALVHPDDRARVQRLTDESARDGRPAAFDFRICRPDGTVRVLNLRSEVSSDATGRPVRMFGTDQDVTELRQAEVELRRSQQQLRSLAAHQLEVREEERGRIAREIHDVLGQTLTALKFDATALRDAVERGQPGTAGRFQEMADLLDAAVKSVRRLATELRPVVLDQLGLADAVEWLARDFQRRTGIECRARIRLADATPPREVSTGLFRILQEALTNVARHAGATAVEVALEHTQGSLSLTVTDNGRGLGDGDQSRSDALGILGMRERALLLGGGIDLKGETGKGTRLTARIPLK